LNSCLSDSGFEVPFSHRPRFIPNRKSTDLVVDYGFGGAVYSMETPYQLYNKNDCSEFTGFNSATILATRASVNQENQLSVKVTKMEVPS
jgi:hypothetical protein